MNPARPLARAMALACLSTSALAAPAFASPLYVHRGNGSDGRRALPAFEAAIGRKADGVVDFVAYDSWKSFDSDGPWASTAGRARATSWRRACL